MKWGGCKKWELGGVLCKKVENKGLFFVKKKWKMGVFYVNKVENCFFVKSGPFLNAGCIMYSISIYFTFYLFGGCVSIQRTPCLQAWGERTANDENGPQRA